MIAVPVQESAATLEHAYLQIARIRAFEKKALELFGEQYIRGSVHPYTGMEAIAVGVCGVLEESDYITSTHRGHGHCIAKGLDLRLMMAEITGRETGYCKGRGGSMHITAMRHGMLGADAIVCGSLALATGAAYGLRLQGKDAVTVAFFGDGGANQGLFHEAANLASVLSAPVVFVCENNQWAISTPISAAINVEDLATRAAGYGFPGEVVDGNDVLAVREVARRAVERARAGDGPTLIEAKTYRHRGHYEGDMGRYRSAEEVEEWMAKDPILNLEADLLQGSRIAQQDLDHVRNDIEEQLDAAAAFAEESPHPHPEEGLEHVFATSAGVTST